MLGNNSGLIEIIYAPVLPKCAKCQLAIQKQIIYGLTYSNCIKIWDESSNLQD